MSDAVAPALTLAGEYRREVGASVARIWENVFDWEHLPALHAQDFAGVELLDLDREGWRVSLTSRGAAEPQVLKLSADRARKVYVVRTESGPGAGAEIRTGLTALDPQRTVVHVRFHLPVTEPGRAERAGRRLAAAYARLWAEDEAMMQRREALSRGRVRVPDGVLDLGAVELVRTRAPFTLEWQGARVRMAEFEGALVAFSAVCPHWLGPLDETPVESGCVRCPWHGYRFDVRTGESADGRPLRLAPLFEVIVREGRAQLRVRGEADV